jgi:hypothetical protein
MQKHCLWCSPSELHFWHQHSVPTIQAICFFGLVYKEQGPLFRAVDLFVTKTHFVDNQGIVGVAIIPVEAAGDQQLVW